MTDATEGGTWESLPVEIRAMILKRVSPSERLREVNEETVIQLRNGLSCGCCSSCCCSWVHYVERVCYMSSQDWETGLARAWPGARKLNVCMMWETIALYADVLMGEISLSFMGWPCRRESPRRLLVTYDEDGEAELQAQYVAFVRPRLPCLLEYVDVACTVPVWCDAVTSFRQRYESRFGRLFGSAWSRAGRSEMWNLHRYTARATHA